MTTRVSFVPSTPDVALVSTYFNDVVADTVQQIKGSKGQLFWLDLVNTVAAATYVQLFWLPATSVQLGVTHPNWVIRIASSGSKTVALPLPVGGSGTGLSIACTSGPQNTTGAAVSVAALYY